MCKASDQFYTDLENDVLNADYEDILNKAKKIAKKTFESQEIEKVEKYTVSCYYHSNVVWFTSVDFHPILEKV